MTRPGAGLGHDSVPLMRRQEIVRAAMKGREIVLSNTVAHRAMLLGGEPAQSPPAAADRVRRRITALDRLHDRRYSSAWLEAGHLLVAFGACAAALHRGRTGRDA